MKVQVVRSSLMQLQVLRICNEKELLFTSLALMCMSFWAVSFLSQLILLGMIEVHDHGHLRFLLLFLQ
ncbi:unnamed protein product [Amoebophrya sp. A25]|nr:unnamed protein product [Amoebophrya sp. A25]|eukprot:GSA25T00022887001.1